MEFEFFFQKGNKSWWIFFYISGVEGFMGNTFCKVTWAKKKKEKTDEYFKTASALKTFFRIALAIVWLLGDKTNSAASTRSRIISILGKALQLILNFTI